MAKVTAYFSSVFGASPFRDLQTHAAICIKAAEVLLELFPATNTADWVAVEAAYNRLTELEHDADELKRKIRSNLPQGFFLPVARADLLDLLGRQDELANNSRDIAGLVLGRRMQFPEPLRARVLELVQASIDACRRSSDIINTLDELIDSAFRGPQAKLVSEMIEDVEKLEHDTDQIVMQIRASLFEMENDLPAVQVMFLYRALDLVAELGDCAERVAHRVQLMLAK